jgi:hypothetical protein
MQFRLRTLLTLTAAVGLLLSQYPSPLGMLLMAWYEGVAAMLCVAWRRREQWLELAGQSDAVAQTTVADGPSARL